MVEPMLMRALILSFCALPTMIWAGMTADEFEAFTDGKTLFFSLNGRDYGVERYLGDRRVEWSFLDGECTRGVWYEENDLICFAYEGWQNPQCWTFEPDGAGMTAQFSIPNEAGQFNRYFAYEKDEPMVCIGPDTGV